MKLKNIASAVAQNGGKSSLDLSYPCLTTAKIGQIVPIFTRECIPGDSFNVHNDVFSRFAPLAVPAYVNLKLRTLSVFVPYHQIFDGAESFFDNQKKFHGLNNGIPFFQFADIRDMFMSRSPNLLLASQITDPNSPYDIAFITPSSAAASRVSKWSLTAKGHYFMKLLRSLGYNFGKEFSAEPDTMSSKYFNALPLLAFAHAYNSYLSYSPSQNTSTLTYTLEKIKRGTMSVSGTVTGYHVRQDDIFNILSSILLTYDDDLLNLSWASPYGSNQALNASNYYHNSQFTTIGADEDVNWTKDSGANINVVNGEMITSSQIRLLMKFDDFFRRSNFAGSKDIEQLYSRFGVKIDDYRTRYPYFLRESTESVSIGDVTSTASTETSSNTDGAVLGAYAGKAISQGDSSFQFESHDYGMLITLAWYSPTVYNYKGFDKECLRINPVEFYTPELDQGFADTLDWAEWTPERYNSSTNTFNTTNKGNIPLYVQYLFSRPRIVGDFRNFPEYETWHFGREDVTYETNPQSDALIYMPQEGTQFERIFNVLDPSLVNADTIYMDVQNEVHATRPMKDFTGKVGLGVGDVDVSLNGTTLN